MVGCGSGIAYKVSKYIVQCIITLYYTMRHVIIWIVAAATDLPPLFLDRARIGSGADTALGIGREKRKVTKVVTK